RNLFATFSVRSCFHERGPHGRRCSADNRGGRRGSLDLDTAEDSRRTGFIYNSNEAPASGEVAEWLKAAVCYTVRGANTSIAGSNPPLSARSSLLLTLFQIQQNARCRLNHPLIPGHLEIGCS